ncbi:zonular occludens toxin domain-containing protein [Curvibacter sp. HBC28]|uniref:Zonular occludens toxin domain-containing protein n=1 Tax=Curvibacter microcysteis TaxID=3026419 RepID=A0ABT5ML11_9BURK|nr:zonular occludens toxin domain-containing protein [Curvibacter sp. HBC28]MDD0817254.1 zonular occludens toxin domain-containing protein [Curvibacter sp. HBC28]
MINLLLGSSGSGKSYEANAYHILNALQSGRRVITNLPVVVSAYAELDPQYRDLIEVRNKPQPIRGTWTPTAESGAFTLFADGHVEAPDADARAFGGVWDYYTTWRNADGVGPLFVIDECQYCIPAKSTQRAVEEWVALHRHFNVDVLYITQSYGKISQAIRDNVQMVYRCRKNVALGAPSSYTRKVQDGIRGEVVNTSIRKYNKRYFGLYKSHTQGVAAEEFKGSDIRPWWKNWTFMGAGVCAVIVVSMVLGGGVKNPMNPNNVIKTAKPGPAAVVEASPSAIAEKLPAAAPVVERVASAVESVAPEKKEEVVDDEPEPYGTSGIHLMGSMRSGARVVYSFMVSQNGYPVHYLTQRELEATGYRFKPLADCSGYLYFKNKVRPVLCDLPQMNPGVGSPPATSGPNHAKSA